MIDTNMYRELLFHPLQVIKCVVFVTVCIHVYTTRGQPSPFICTCIISEESDIKRLFGGLKCFEVTGWSSERVGMFRQFGILPDRHRPLIVPIGTGFKL